MKPPKYQGTAPAPTRPCRGWQGKGAAGRRQFLGPSCTPLDDCRDETGRLFVWFWLSAHAILLGFSLSTPPLRFCIYIPRSAAQAKCKTASCMPPLAAPLAFVSSSPFGRRECSRNRAKLLISVWNPGSAGRRARLADDQNYSLQDDEQSPARSLRARLATTRRYLAELAGLDYNTTDGH
jgi:hypothetical protein